MLFSDIAKKGNLVFGDDMRFYRKKFLVAILCLAVSAALSWKLFAYVDSSKETVFVLQASQRIEQGTRIAAGMLRRVEIGAYGVDAQALTTDDGVIGKYAACDLYPGDTLTAQKFKTIDETADNYVLKTRDNGLCAVSVELKGVSAALSGKLKIGDVVSAYVFISEGGMGSNKGSVVAYPELQFLEIAAVTNNRAEDIFYESERDSESERVKVTGDSSIPSTVIFIVDEQQAIRLVEAENIGLIHLVFRGRGEYARTLVGDRYGDGSDVAGNYGDSGGGADGGGALGSDANGGDVDVDRGDALGSDALSSDALSSDALGGDTLGGDALGGDTLGGDALGGYTSDIDVDRGDDTDIDVAISDVPFDTQYDARFNLD